MSVYDRMFEDEELFWLGYGVLYITEMCRVKKIENPRLRIKSKGLAETWYKLCEKHNALSKKCEQLTVSNGIYSFGCSVSSLYKLLRVVKFIPDTMMDLQIRERLKVFTYAGNSPINKTRINILKLLENDGELTTNELARRINFNSGTIFRKHLELLQSRGLIKRNKKGKQKIVTELTFKGREFINMFKQEIEKQPNYSLYQKCFKDKQLAADLLLIVSELEMGGILQRQPYLQMTSRDFVEFVLTIAKRWQWTNRDKVIERKNGDYKPIYFTSLHSNAAREIYYLSGSCADKHKDRDYRHMFNLKKPGNHKKVGETKRNIIKLVNNGFHTSKEIAFDLNIGVQNIQRTLSSLSEEGILKREKIGMAYYYTLT